jgi:integrase
MEESSRWDHQNKCTGLQQMGRGPGVRATSASSIQIDFRYKGKRCRERISLPPTPANLKYAKRLKAVIDHEIATNTFDYARHFPESPRARRNHSDSRSLKSSLLNYCDSLAGQLQPETVDEYRHDAEIVAKGLGESATLQNLTRAQVRTWVSTLTLSKKRIDNLLIPLRGALNQAVEDGQIQSNPLAGFKIRRTETRKEIIDPFTPAEIKKLGEGELGNLWTFWAWTGLRSGELIGLQWRDISRDFATLSIRRSIRVGREKLTKTRSGIRNVQVLSYAKDAIRMAIGQDGRSDRLPDASNSSSVWLNPNTGERWHEDRALARAFKRDCEACGVRYRYPYQLRHTYATWALSAGENPSWIAEQMGHSDTMMLFRVYGKWMPSLDPGAGSKMVKAVGRKAA